MTICMKTLQWISCIQYPIQFQESWNREVGALINSVSKVNAITHAFAARFDFSPQSIDINLQKIDGSALKTYGIVITGFSIKDKSDRIRFFKETYLLADTIMKVVLGMFFLTLNSVDVHFDTRSFN